jgi:hypothetical protein
MEKSNFGKINTDAFKTLNSAQMKRVKGGYTEHTLTISAGAITVNSAPTKGQTDSDDGVIND